VERGRGGALVVRALDYKVTRDRTKFRRLLDPERDLGRLGFQIPVYLLGALAAGIDGVGDETRFEGGYVVLLVADKWVVQEMPRALLGLVPPAPGAPAAIPSRIEELVAGVRAGRFDVDPHPCDRFCAYRTVCRYQPPPVEDEPGNA
jgi:PD-(D/E)XK nuclease superfamily protein